MTRLIDADVFAKKAFDVAYPVVHGWNDHERGLTLLGIAQLLDEQPTVDAVPVRHGKWIKLDMHAHLADHKCTACGQECYVPTCMGEPMYIYCPNCGARMDEEDE